MRTIVVGLLVCLALLVGLFGWIGAQTRDAMALATIGLALMLLMVARIIQADGAIATTPPLSATTPQTHPPQLTPLRPEDVAASNRQAAKVVVAIGIVVAAFVAANQYNAMQLPTGDPRVKSELDAYKSCAEHAVAAGRAASIYSVAAFSQDMVRKALVGDRYTVTTSATVSGQNKPFTCTVEWVTGSTYRLISLE